MTGTRVANVTCLGCGCSCDDLHILVRGGRIVEAANACSLGAAWFGDGVVPARVRVSGRDAPRGEAIEAAAAVLERAARRLVYLAPDVSCEAQRTAIALADRLGAALDSITSATAMPSILAAQERGRASATLGEIRNRADTMVFWGVDPADRYPRYWTRYAPEPPGVHVPLGRASRRIVAVDIGGARGPDDADMRLAIEPRDEVPVLTAAAALVRPHGLERPDGGARPRSAAKDAAGVWQAAHELASVLARGRYVAMVADAEPSPDRDPGRADALLALVQTLNAATRAALSTLRAGGNRSGADAVMTWQTGYPAAVDFSRGAPRYRPLDGTAGARLERQEVDAALVVGSAACIPERFTSIMSRMPCVVVGPRASEGPLADAAVVIDTGVAGIHEAGTAFRMDEVPLPLRSIVGGPPTATAVLDALLGRMRGG